MITAYVIRRRLSRRKRASIRYCGDSLQMVMLRDSSTVAATTDVMIHHTKAVIAGAPDTFVVTDMPFGSCSSAAAAASGTLRENRGRKAGATQ